MKREVINGYEWLIFEESEQGQAQREQANGHPRVLIASKCSVCHEPIEARIGDGPVSHSDGYHAAAFNANH